MGQLNRKSPTKNRKHYLENEAEGTCPLCNVALTYEKDGYFKRSWEAAHIYPLNPTDEEIALLKDEEKLSEDVNATVNFIALCSGCHDKFDKPRTLDGHYGYRNVLALKKELINRSLSKSVWHDSQLDDAIIEILDDLSTVDDDVVGDLNLDLVDMEKKFQDTLSTLTRVSIKNKVRYFAPLIKVKMASLESEGVKGTLIGLTIKVSYFRYYEIYEGDQERIYESLIDWVCRSKHGVHREAAATIIAYFILNCEVFGDVA